MGRKISQRMLDIVESVRQHGPCDRSVIQRSDMTRGNFAKYLKRAVGHGLLWLDEVDGVEVYGVPGAAKPAAKGIAERRASRLPKVHPLQAAWQ